MTKIILVLGTLLTTISFVPYIRDIIYHGVRPRLVTWLIWATLLGLMTGVSIEERQVASAVVSVVSMIGCLAVALLGWRYASRSITGLEKLTLAVAGMAIVFWLLFDRPLVVLIAALVADLVAYIPTFIHGWNDPDEESWQSYAIGAVGELLVLLAAFSAQASFVGLLYPLYAGLFGFGMVGLIFFSRWWHDGGEEAATEASW